MSNTQIVRLDRGFPGGWQAGQILRVKNIGRGVPIPAEILERSSRYDGAVPADIPEIDAADAINAARAASAAVTPPADRLLTSAELWKKSPVDTRPGQV